MTNGKGWYDPGPLAPPGGEQTHRLIEAMCNEASLPTSREITHEEALRLIKELEQSRPNSPVLARAKAILKVEGKAKG
jgi:hypothetical protein